MKARRLETKEEPMFLFESEAGKKKPSSKGRQEESPFISGRVSHFVLFKPPSDWIKSTHFRKENQLYSVHQFKY